MRFIIESSKKAITLIELFKVLKNLNNYCTLCCNENELYIQTMDDSHVSLFDLKIKKEWFTEYVANNDIVSFNSNIIVKILNLYTPNTKVTFQTSKNDDYLEINLLQSDGNEKCFEIPLMDIDSELLNTMDIDSTLEFSLNTKQYDKYLTEMSLFGDTMEIVCVNDNIYLKSSGDEGKYTIRIPHDNLENFEVVEDTKLKFKVALKYLNYISKVYTVFKSLNFIIEENSPICITIDDEEYISMKYFIAPKTDDDQETNEDDFSEYENTVIEE
jgi:proliferating cell nuclear antigen PCNA